MRRSASVITHMLRPRRSTRERSRGQTIVELALIIPVMLLLLASASDLARLFHSKIVIANAARAGALEAVRHPTSYQDGLPCDALTNRIMCAITTESNGSILAIDPLDVIVACDPDPCSEVLGNRVRVTVAGEFTLLTPFIGTFFGGQTIPLSSTATAQIAVQPVITAPSATSTPTPTATTAPTPTPTPTPTGTLDPLATPTPTPTPSPTPSPTPACFPPSADFQFSPSTGKKKKTDFQFTDLSTSGPLCPLTWSWNFGDGAGSSSTSSLQNPIHTYQAQGVYTITLVVSNFGGSDSRGRTVTVTP
ncbi:MAG: PKD domain-containing protein [Candidatus Limnocylindrales bacterium]